MFKMGLLAINTLLLCSASNVVHENFKILNYDHPDIVAVEQNNYDTGYFYQTSPFEGDEVNQEIFEDINIQNETINKQMVYVPPTNPFEGDEFVPNKSYLVSYYSHLINNIPWNRLGICGYTGITMFLSFYDSYWNDNFIYDQYDSDVTMITSSLLNSSYTNAYQSPGVRNNITYSSYTIGDLIQQIRSSGITDENSIAFKEALDRKIMGEVYAQIDEGTFLGKLFQIAIANGSIKPHFVENEYHVANEGYLDGIGVNNEIMNSVLADYIQDNDSLRGKVKIVTSKLNNTSVSEKNRIRSEIVEIVKTGRPVLMGGNGYSDKNGNGIQDTYPKLPDGTDDPRNEVSFGHVVVAYDYDENSDILYGNMGWNGSSTTHTNLDNYFNIQMSDYWTLNITSSLPKNRTNNYIFTDKKAYYSPGLDRIFNTISPKEYNFPESYKNENISANIILSKTQETISTNRLRCGYIEGESINISTRRVEPGLAYLEYTFDRDIYQIEVDLSWWSNDEKVSKINSNYRIEYSKYEGIYFEALDLWNVSLSTNRNLPTKVAVTFPTGVKTFRFYGLSSNPINDRNKGRLSIFDMVIIYY